VVPGTSRGDRGGRLQLRQNEINHGDENPHLVYSQYCVSMKTNFAKFPHRILVRLCSRPTLLVYF
jgi:hypothetical protein